jgi:hypothetical protein
VVKAGGCSSRPVSWAKIVRPYLRNIIKQVGDMDQEKKHLPSSALGSIPPPQKNALSAGCSGLKRPKPNPEQIKKKHLIKELLTVTVESCIHERKM